MSYFKTAVLIAAISGLLIIVGRVLGGPGGMVVALIFAFALNGVMYWFSDKIVLAMSHARAVTPEAAPGLYGIVERLAREAKLPMPKVYIVDDPSPNAFATGRNPEHAAVAVTTGILRLLTEHELAGVIAHELSHVRNRDTLVSTIAAGFATAISFLANMAMFFGGGRGRRGGNPIALLLMAILAPLAAALIQAMISRTREYAADSGGAKVSGNPLWLAGALRKLQRGVERTPMDVSPSTAHLFIVSPLSGKSLLTLFSTHPPIEDRVARLEEMAERGRIR